MNLIYILIIIVTVLAVYIYRNLRVSNYFFLVRFDWATIYSLFNLSKEEYSTFVVGDDHKKLVSANLNDNPLYSMMCYFSGYEADNKKVGRACFEYYVIPKAVKGLSSRGHIYDQQNKTFFELSNSVYREVMTRAENKNGERSHISCGFMKDAVLVGSDNKACFWIAYNNKTQKMDISETEKALVIFFNEDYLNMRNSQSSNSKLIFDVYLIDYIGSDSKIMPKIKKIETTDIDVYISNQSAQEDLRSNGFVSTLSEYFKEQKLK